MARLLCKVTEGLRPAEATVELRDFHGRPEFLPVHRDFLVLEGERSYLPVALVHIDERHKAALVALPDEADSGAHCLWARLADLKDYNGPSA
jgi:hypothetical protein